jgi:type IV secretion system protein VirB9
MLKKINFSQIFFIKNYQLKLGYFLLNLLTILFFYSYLLPSNGRSAQLPRYLGSERKFRSYIYNPNELYRYFGHYTYQGFIEFSAGETISTISMGNPTLWLVETLDNRIFLKPVGEDNSETNMTVLTNKRVYHFELVAKEAKGLGDKDLIFVVKFAYPDDKDKNLVEFAKTPPSDEPDMRDLSSYNFNYQYTGEKTIAPSKVFDDGIFTYFQFNSRNTEVPAIYSVDSEGFESLINYRITGTYMVVEKVAPQYSLRNGSDIVCVYNMETYINGKIRRSTVMPNDKNVQPAMQNFGDGGVSDMNSSMMGAPQNSMPQFSAPSNVPNMSMPNMSNDPMQQMMMQQGGQSQGASDPMSQQMMMQQQGAGGDPMANFMMEGENPLMQKKSARSRALGLPF